MFCAQRGSLPLKGFGAYRVLEGVPMGGAYRKEQMQVTGVASSIGMAIGERGDSHRN